jgi:hypothetical protein
VRSRAAEAGASAVRPATSRRAVADLAEWREAIASSQAVRLFLGLANGDIGIVRYVGGQEVAVPIPDGLRDAILDYYLHPEELFARSYRQWAVTRSGDPLLLAQLQRAQRATLPEQWRDDDFAAIAAAFDRLTKRLGWRSPGNS